jgi:hypothetical protein
MELLHGQGAYRRRAAISLITIKKTREEAAALLLLALPGFREQAAYPSHPGQPFRQCPGQQPRRAEGLAGHRAFFLASRMEEVQERPLPASGGAGAAPPPKTTAPASWRLTLPWVSPGWGGLVGGRGRTGRKQGQFRVLGSPSPRSALRNPGPGDHRGGRGIRGPDLFFAKAP